MQFKEGDKVQFIREGSLIDGVVKEFKDCSPDMWYLIDDKCKDSWIFEGHLIPLTPLPVIPQFVADVLQVQKEKWWWSLSESLDLKVYACTSFVKEYSVDIRIKDWLSLPSNQELFARAWLDGYEVEQEPLYYIKVIDRHFGYINLNLKTGAYTTTTNVESDGFKTKFTEKEIKAIDERYWQFKVPVEDLEGE
ncbi:DUF1642 domain-containing protein [Listeria monocytogenes]|uniref:DUF1642 domain-containing protein n=1 Tax=Listeria monocytogenes TaxID=1639 RepID=UPI0016447C0B|nr:DUF1642 domain-containing protein [Listeria monocytogenes]MBC3581215.1 DUF1642 domain-containing protein [Listeria monocytogenes]